MEAGQIIRKKLGLENIDNAKIARVLLSTYRIYYVFYDSHRPQYPITRRRIKQSRRVASIFSGRQFSDENNDVEHTRMAPLLDLDEYGGSVGGDTLIIAIDLAGDFMIEDKEFTSEIRESVSKDVRFFEGDDSGKLEELTVRDLMNNQGISPFTLYYKKERNKVMGSETKNTKLLDLIVNKKEDWVQFDFLSEATDKYKPNHKYTEVNPNTLKIIPNPSKTYTFSLRILDFFSYLDTFSIEETITGKDLKDILDVADIKLWNSIPAYHFQGSNYLLSSVFDASIYPTNIPITVWNSYKNPVGKSHNSEQFLDKDSQSILNQFYFYRNNMASMLTKKLRQEGLI